MFKRENLFKYIIGIIIAVVFLSVFTIYNLSSRISNQEVLSLSEATHEEDKVAFREIEFYEDEFSENIFVEIKGEVLNPDVYEIKKGSIVKDLIVLSGGLTNDGDTSNINQARELQNGECIIVLSKDEILKNEIQEFKNLNLSDENNLVNINRASKEELKTLDGVGDGIADSIIRYREENGEFKNIEDIKNVSRIGEKTFEKFRSKIKVWIYFLRWYT